MTTGFGLILALVFLIIAAAGVMQVINQRRERQGYQALVYLAEAEREVAEVEAAKLQAAETAREQQERLVYQRRTGKHAADPAQAARILVAEAGFFHDSDDGENDRSPIIRRISPAEVARRVVGKPTRSHQGDDLELLTCLGEEDRVAIAQMEGNRHYNA